MEALQEINKEYTDYPSYLADEQDKKVIETYNAIIGKRIQLLLQLEGV